MPKVYLSDPFPFQLLISYFSFQTTLPVHAHDNIGSAACDNKKQLAIRIINNTAR
jgi:hypothetical protein